MKKYYSQFVKFLTILTILFALPFHIAKSSPAFPKLIDYKQPNGAIIKIRLMGDEDLRWAETEDGYTLLLDKEGFYVFADKDSLGNLVATNMRAAGKEKRSSYVESRLSRIGKKMIFSEAQINNAQRIRQARYRSARSQKTNSTTQVTSIVGSRKFLVILMQFPDKQFTRTKLEFDALFNQEGYRENGNSGSVRDFYKENSFGQLDLTSDVVGVYTASHNAAYYGGNNGNAGDRNPQELAKEALEFAASEVTLSDYDYDGDGFLDGVHIIYAGHGEEAGGGADCIWAHECMSSSIICTVSGVNMDKYSCSPELRNATGHEMTYIGVACHEIGHALGTMDFYDTNYGLNGSYPGTGNWDVMAGGNWNNDGACPAHFNPYSKIYDFGWSGVNTVNEIQTVNIKSKTKDNFYRIDSNKEGDYFLLEYRSQDGFDTYIPGHGLMVYRATDNLSNKSLNTINASHKQQFYPLCANATSALPTSSPFTYGTVNYATTPFPGLKKVKEITNETTPSLLAWDETPSLYCITDINEDVTASSVSLCISAADFNAHNFKVAEVGFNDVKLQWDNVASSTVLLVANVEDVFGNPTESTYSVGDELLGGGTVLYIGQGDCFTHKNLVPDSYHYYQLYTLDGVTGSWGVPIETHAHTAYESIRTFPFFEDFETLGVNTTWKQEYIAGCNNWNITSAWDRTSRLLFFDWKDNNGKQQKTRVIMPAIDFSGYSNAVLQFDYRNMLLGMKVLYRLSGDDEWKTLSDLHNHYFPRMQMNEAIDSEEHFSVLLPTLSDRFEIAFEADFSWRGVVKSNLEVGTIDNISISVDLPVHVETSKPSVIAPTWAEFTLVCVDGMETINNKGIEWSSNQVSWNVVNSSSLEDYSIKITGLRPSEMIYYRAFAETSSGRYYGSIKSFSTLSPMNGEGTENEPFLITCLEDWSNLQSIVKGGSDCSGLHFKLTSNISLSPEHCLERFNGILDGDNHIITISSTDEKKWSGLISRMAKDGVVKVLKLVADDSFVPDASSAMFCNVSYGLISKCNVEINSLSINTESSFGAFVYQNHGKIENCQSNCILLSWKHQESEDVLLSSGLSIGGICCSNQTIGIIADCVFRGHIIAGEFAHVGGIAASNWGTIRNCANLGTLETDIDYPRGNEIGGISASSIGGVNDDAHVSVIEQCTNKGEIIIGAATDNNVGYYGGIVGMLDDMSIVENCYNVGKITVKAKGTKERDYIGGIVGYSDGNISNCYTSFDCDNQVEKTNYLKAIVAKQRDGHVSHSFYHSTNLNDDYSLGIQEQEISRQSFVDALNRNANQSLWVRGLNKYPVFLWEIEDGLEAYDTSIDESGDDFTDIPMMARNLRVKEKTDHSITIQWDVEPTTIVMLISDAGSSFPVNEMYSVGDRIGGATVLFVGTGSEFCHEDLIQNKEYYYRLYTCTPLPTMWQGEIDLIAKTEENTEKISDFPYVENFDYGSVNFQQEALSAGLWKHVGTNLYPGYNGWFEYYNISNSAEDWKHLVDVPFSRFILPTFDFTGKNNAILELDYRGAGLVVWYRSSSSDSWRILKELEYKKSTFSHVSISLPDISSKYQISISGMRTSDLAQVDNIKIATDQYFSITTGRVINYTQNGCELEIVYAQGINVPISRGVEISTDKINWQKIPFDTDERTYVVRNLSPGSYYWRAYASISGGIQKEGDIKEFYISNNTTEESLSIEELSSTSNSIKFRVNNALNPNVIYGVEWKDQEAPSWQNMIIENDKTRDVTISGLNGSTSYQIRAFAKNIDNTLTYSEIVGYATTLEGSGCVDDPYLIHSLEEMNSLRELGQYNGNFVGRVCALANDINMQGDIYDFEPIVFYGEFDGKGNTLYNLKGELFSQYPSYIHDLHLRDCEVVNDGSYSRSMGTVAGKCAKIERCSFIGNVSCSDYRSQVGCLVGFSWEIKDCFAIAIVTAPRNGCVGGIAIGGNISNCYYGQFADCINQSSYPPHGLILEPYQVYDRNRYYYKIDNCYYMVPSNPNYYDDEYGTPMLGEDMKNGELYSKLPKDVWTIYLDGETLDGGYPQLKHPESHEIKYSKPGDANGNGVVNISDVMSIASYITGNTPEDFVYDNADVSKDGNIDVVDIVATIRIIMGGDYEAVGPADIVGSSARNLLEIDKEGFLSAEFAVNIRGIDIEYSGDMMPLDDLSQFVIMPYEKDGNKHILAFAMYDPLQNGKSSLFQLSSGSEILDCIFVDENANIVSYDMNFNGFTTHVEGSPAPISVVKTVICDLYGRIVGSYLGGSDPDVLLPQGIYIKKTELSDGKIKSKKIFIE